MRFVTALFCVLFAVPAFSQSGYKLDFKIKGWKDTTAYLGYYYGELTYLKDTARVNHEGAFTFQDKKNLPQGVYMLVLGTNKIFEIVIGEDQQFGMETSSDDYVKNMKVTGDADNKLFFDNMLFNMDRHKEAEPFMKVLQDSTISKDDPRKVDARAAFGKVNEKVIAYQNDIIEKYPATMTARLFKVTKQVHVPDPPRRADGSIDSAWQFRYYREHFFDYFDLADDALLRLPRPFYNEKVKEYLTKLFVPQADTITRAIVRLAEKAKKNQETYKYLVWNCLYNYQNPEIMGLDRVYVNLYDRYFATGQMDFWIQAKTKQSVKEYADKLRGSLVGDVGRNLMMQDASLQPRSLYDIKKKYTLIYFFDPDCGHCREESPKLVDFYNKNKLKLDLEVFAVSIDTSLQKMKDYIKEMKMTWVTVNGPRSYVGPYNKLYYAETTPTIYILDEKKKIIAKKPPVEKLGDFFENYEKFQKQKATGKGS